MKDKIKYFSKGDFQIKKPDIVFPETNLLCKIGEGEVYSGEFLIENSTDGDIRGLVYPSSFRMRCLKQGFQGNPVTIQFEYDGRGLSPGYVEKGHFTIVCNGGEFEVGFSAIIEKPYVETSQGRIQDLRGFKKLAYNNYDEAKSIFKSREFYELIKYEQPKVKNLYHNMRKWNLDELGMEEFLVGIKQKEKIFLVTEGKERIYRNVDGIYEDNVIVTKNTWGYLPLKIYSDCDFIEPITTNITTQDFQGMSYELKYIIKNTSLHGGRNFGNIIIETPFDKIKYFIEVDNSVGELEDNKKIEYINAYLLKNVLHLVGGHISHDKWIVEATKLINELQYLEPENEEYKLYQAHAYLMIGQREEARWILEAYNYSKFTIGRDIELDAYYLFLMALEKKDSSYNKKVIDELHKAYLKNPKSWRVLCMLLEIDPYYHDQYEKKHALENQYNLGGNHLILYLEGLKCFRDRPTNLKRLGDFEIQILRFAVKYKLLNKELALYTANLAGQQKNFDKRVLDVLEKMYEIYPDFMILTSICTILIKGNMTQSKYFKWYALAVEEEVKIAKLFECYMESVDANREEPLHRTVLLYFAHGNNLPYEKAALLYANLISYEKEGSELYKCYIDKIKVFTLQQLEMRRINENLRVLYRTFLSTDEMNIEKIKAIYDIAHSYRITTKVPNMKFVLVITNDGGIYQKVPYTEQGSQVILDSKDDILAWEAMDGTHYVGSVKYNTERLFNEHRFIDMCKYRLSFQENHEELEDGELTYEHLIEEGLIGANEQKAFQLCVRKLKELDYASDDFLVYALFYLFKKEEYDKNTLSYLATFFCGSTREMKELWYAAKDYEVNTKSLAERIITQGIFSEAILNDDIIFKDYYHSGAYFRVEEAYIAYICHEHLTKNRILSEEIVEIIINELRTKANIADIVKIAMLKYFVGQDIREVEDVLKTCMQALCEKQIYFDFYLEYSEDWLREVQLWDKTLVSYRAQIGGKVKLIYQLQTEDKESVEYETEVLLPVYDDIYVRKFLVFKDEVLRYYFKETLGDVTLKSEKIEYRIEKEQEYVGKFGRLNDIINYPEERDQRMTSYALEEMLANKMFVLYE